MAVTNRIFLLSIVAATSVSFGVPASQTQTHLRPTEVTKARLQPIVKGILAAWDNADVVCLGEDHGSKNDSDLRIALVEHPDFVRKVRVIMVESASITQQDVLDRFVLDGEEMSREKLSVVWDDATGSEVWAAPIYEAFMRAVRKANQAVPREQRVRLLAGDNPRESNRGRFIRDDLSFAAFLLNRTNRSGIITGGQNATKFLTDLRCIALNISGRQ